MTQQVVSDFAQDGYELFLFGSRSKIYYRQNYQQGLEQLLVGTSSNARITHETDWDYAMQDSPEVYQYLTSRGFVAKPDQFYYDSLTAHVFERTYEDGTVIQISTKYNLQDFKQFWNWIPKSFYREFLWKRGPNQPTQPMITAMINSLWYMFSTLRDKYKVSEDVLWE